MVTPRLPTRPGDLTGSWRQTTSSTAKCFRVSHTLTWTYTEALTVCVRLMLCLKLDSIYYDGIHRLRTHWRDSVWRLLQKFSRLIYTSFRNSPYAISRSGNLVNNIRARIFCWSFHFDLCLSMICRLRAIICGIVSPFSFFRVPIVRLDRVLLVSLLPFTSGDAP